MPAKWNKEKSALVIAVNNAVEHHVTIVYRSIFLGETLSLISQKAGWTAEAYDQSFQDLALTDFLRIFRSEPDVVFVWGDVHHSEVMTQIARQLKKVSPSSQVFAFGRSTTFVPQFFSRAPFDAVHVSGDREASIGAYLQYLDGERAIADVPGVSYRLNGEEKFASTPGAQLPPEQWPLPELSKLPIDKYKEYVQKAYGDRYSRRVSATVAKGCTWNCAYCGATQEEGHADRRQSIKRIYEWVALSDLGSYECYLHLYAPDLFYDAEWIKSFCTAYDAAHSQFIWRGVTTTVTLQDRSLVLQAGASGCREIAIGVENISSKNLKAAKSTLEEIDVAARNCLAAGISLKGLVMLGYPSQTQQDVEFLIDHLVKNKMIIRFTGYTPLHKLRTMTLQELERVPLEDYDRRTYFDPKGSKLSREFFYRTLTENDGYVYP